MKLSQDLVFLDLETTGTWVEKDKIIEIALVKIRVDGSKEVYDKKINPQISIPEVVSDLTGISNADVKDSPIFESVAREILEFIGNSDFGGFNIERFDLPLLKREFNDCGHKFEWDKSQVFDSQKIFHLNEKRDLTAAFKFYCGKDLENAHSALADTEATVEILKKQLEFYGEGSEDADVLKKFDYKKTAEFYDDDRKFRWWNGKLYMMFGKYAKQYSLQDVAKKDSGYLEWILSAGFSQEVKDLVADALKGQFPKQQEVLSSDDLDDGGDQLSLF